jgi:hypothetical protein
MNTSRTALAVLAMTSLVALDLRPAAAETYRPWCVQYTGKGSAVSCAFTSFEQCMMTAHGAGGHCVQNPWYLQYGERSPAYGTKYQGERGYWR